MDSRAREIWDRGRLVPPGCGIHWIQRPELHLVHLFELPWDSQGLHEDLLCEGPRLGIQKGTQSLSSLPTLPGTQQFRRLSGSKDLSMWVDMK